MVDVGTVLMSFETTMRYQSTVTPQSFAGSRTMPRSRFLERSGFKVRLPPERTSPWELQVACVKMVGYVELPLVGEHPGPFISPAAAPSVVGANRLTSVGARNPVEAAPRNVT